MKRHERLRRRLFPRQRPMPLADLAGALAGPFVACPRDCGRPVAPGRELCRWCTPDRAESASEEETP